MCLRMCACIQSCKQRLQTRSALPALSACTANTPTHEVEHTHTHTHTHTHSLTHSLTHSHRTKTRCGCSKLSWKSVLYTGLRLKPASLRFDHLKFSPSLLSISPLPLALSPSFSIPATPSSPSFLDAFARSNPLPGPFLCQHVGCLQIQTKYRHSLTCRGV